MNKPITQLCIAIAPVRINIAFRTILILVDLHHSSTIASLSQYCTFTQASITRLGTYTLRPSKLASISVQSVILCANELILTLPVITTVIIKFLGWDAESPSQTLRSRLTTEVVWGALLMCLAWIPSIASTALRIFTKFRLALQYLELLNLPENHVSSLPQASGLYTNYLYLHKVQLIFILYKSLSIDLSKTRDLYARKCLLYYKSDHSHKEKLPRSCLDPLSESNRCENLICNLRFVNTYKLGNKQFAQII